METVHHELPDVAVLLVPGAFMLRRMEQKYAHRIASCTGFRYGQHAHPLWPVLCQELPVEEAARRQEESLKLWAADICGANHPYTI